MYPQVSKLTLENAPIGKDLLPRIRYLSEKEALSHVQTFIKDPNPLWFQRKEGSSGCIVHPSWITAQMTRMIEKSLPHLPAIHTQSHVQFLNVAYSNQTFITAGHFVKAFERKNHHYAVVDGVVVSKESKLMIAKMRHTTIFKIRSSL